jgi:hypothetical protein
MSICTGAVVPFWLHMNLLLVIVLVTCSSGPGIADVFPLLPRDCLSSCLHRFNIRSCCECLHIIYGHMVHYDFIHLFIHTYSYMHAYVYLRNYYVRMFIDVVWLNDWDPAKKPHTPFFRRCGGQAASCCSLASCWSGMAATCPVEHVIWWLNSLLVDSSSWHQ